MIHIHTGPGRCCAGESAADVLKKLKAAVPRARKGEPPEVFAQREQAWRAAIEREELRRDTGAILAAPDVEGLPPSGVTGIPGALALGGETDPAKVAAAILKHTPDLHPLDRQALEAEAYPDPIPDRVEPGPEGRVVYALGPTTPEERAMEPKALLEKIQGEAAKMRRLGDPHQASDPEQTPPLRDDGAPPPWAAPIAEQVAKEEPMPKRKRGPDKTGRRYYEVRWDKGEKVWTWSERGQPAIAGPSRGEAIAAARAEAKVIEDAGGLAEVVLFTKKGSRIGKRDSAGKDPKRRKG